MSRCRWCSSRYIGPFAHPQTDIDDGVYRTSFSDVRFAVRYNLVREGAVITPYIGSVVPSSNYAYYGHAATGQQLNELQVGVYAAKLLERGLPGLFVSGRYGFGFVEKVLDISHNRSLGNLEVGYFFNSRFRAFTMANAGLTHGGIDFPINGLPGLPVEYRPNHDQIQRVNFLEVGPGGAFSMTDSLDVFGSFSKQVAGRNGHVRWIAESPSGSAGGSGANPRGSRRQRPLRRVTLPTPRPRNAKARCSGASARSHERLCGSLSDDSDWVELADWVRLKVKTSEPTRN